MIYVYKCICICISVCIYKYIFFSYIVLHFCCGTSQNSSSKLVLFFVSLFAIKSKTKLVHFRKLHFASLTTHLSNAYVVRLHTHTEYNSCTLCGCGCVRVLMTCSQIQINILLAKAGDKTHTHTVHIAECACNMMHHHMVETGTVSARKITTCQTISQASA